MFLSRFENDDESLFRQVLVCDFGVVSREVLVCHHLQIFFAIPKNIVKEIHEYDFKVFRSDFWTDEEKTSVILLEFEVWNLPKIMHHQGPPIDQDAKNQEKFLEKYDDDKPYIKDGRWVVDCKRKYPGIENFLKLIVKEKRGFGKDLKKAKLKIVEDKKILSIKGEGYRKFLTKFL